MIAFARMVSKLRKSYIPFRKTYTPFIDVDCGFVNVIKIEEIKTVKAHTKKCQR